MLQWARLGRFNQGREQGQGRLAHGDGFLSLIERKTALGIYLIAAIATMLVWGSETYAGVGTGYDMLAQPFLAALMLVMWVALRRVPGALLTTQRIAVSAVCLYFALGTANAMFLSSHMATPYWVASNFQWMPVIALLLHLIWPWRWAVTFSLALLGLVAIPPFLIATPLSDPQWEDFRQSLLINGVLMQFTFLASLLSVNRLKHGVSLVVAGDHHGSTDAHDALNAWVKERTKELAKAKDDAEAASLAKSRFLAVMSHELRTPLHAMLVSADLLADPSQRPREPRDALLINTIHSSGQHLLSLIDQVLELSRIESGKLEPVRAPINLALIAQKALASVSSQATVKGLALRLHVAPELSVHRLGDELRLTQVLINLMANAIKFTDRGHVSLSIAVSPDGHSVRLSVTDSGKGMAPQEQERVFDAFFQVENNSTRSQGGVGLGLTITQELVSLMQGSIQVHSQEAHGTRIDIDLPLPAVSPEDVVPAQLGAERLSLQGAEVLVVDDDPVNAMLATEVLRAAGATVFHAETGPAALNFLRQHTPHVVLMDWCMPGMDGLEATRRLRAGEAGEASRDIPVLGLTANAFTEDRKACLSAGMNRVLTKPVSRQQLLGEVGYWTQALT